ncbi:tRNA pseudouridine(38-40) synthase TruA [Thioalkalivibrio denitrificans]|uniref:tRNA pseudouridine synthase A n=1 Tax=Thioalkalivibrio denitrificans TaxID=108003 RepID=A0A1V3NBL7_9GAMM|nr:tRNA pseudouridine(38-40) synthase TruA [Thioalkalivibrio denitrificans]OOG22333.1 tRNA pseudouridine(38-40) synthase TruA [Thioalkalivibrio denitrificans]
MKRLALGLEYDGADFCGWQSQKHARGVQACVEQALSKVANQPVKVVCAGRTDAGVHATCQVIHFDTDAERTERSWILGGNSHLPPQVSLLWAREMDPGFSARFSARSRRYRYVIFNRWVRPGVLHRKVSWHHRPLDAGLMHEAGQRLLGEWDFTSFRAVGCQAKSPVRTLLSLDVSRRGDFIYLDVHANAFLHHMVRNIAGVLMAVGEGDRPMEWVSEVLHARDRTLGGVTASPHGLYLVHVEYEAETGIVLEPVLPEF